MKTATDFLSTISPARKPIGLVVLLEGQIVVEDDAISRAVRAEQMRIAKEVNDQRWWWKKCMVETGHDRIFGEGMPYLNFVMTILLDSVYPWQEWFDMGPIHGGE